MPQEQDQVGRSRGNHLIRLIFACAPLCRKLFSGGLYTIQVARGLPVSSGTCTSIYSHQHVFFPHFLIDDHAKFGIVFLEAAI